MATCYEHISVPDCNQLLSVCGGLLVSRTWRSIDPCVFLEIGQLPNGDSGKPSGSVSIMVECDWRIERPRSIQVGSGFSTKRIDNQLETIAGIAVNSIEISGSVPEITMHFADRRKFRTFTNWDCRPRWSIGFNDRALFPLHPGWQGIDVTPWMYVRSGRIEIEYCYDDTKASVRRAIKRMGLT